MPKLECKLFVPQDLDTVFEFFSDAANLQELTPGWLDFRILTPNIEMRPGAMIDYKLRVRGIPLRWRSEITEWEPPHRFVDNQVRGPYRRWHHQHVFKAVDGGTEVIDIVDYSAPGGFLVEKLFVDRDIRRIFAYRHERLQELFGA
jgi:ligand-binding SRPBCC domain-containing protein